jgi:hypothetical protein
MIRKASNMDNHDREAIIASCDFGKKVACDVGNVRKL